ncbi:MAG: hypothetical protein ABFS56_07195 [Pseudomonadota bacterium]
MNNFKLQYLVDFLLLMGWIPTSEGKKFREYQPPKCLGLPMDYFLELPKDDSKNGFNKYAQRIVEILSKIYHCNPEDLQIVLEKGHNIFSMGRDSRSFIAATNSKLKRD